MKKFLSILLAAMMVLATASFAMAFEITAPDNDHTYEIFQIFKGTYDDATMTLSDVVWGANGTGTENEAVASTTLDELKALTTQEGVTDKDKLDKILPLADLTGTPYMVLPNTDDSNSAVIDAGYYLIRDKYDDMPVDESATLYVVQVASNINIVPKTETVNFEKKVKDTNDTTGETSGWQDSADYDIGDKVPFQLKFTFGQNYGEYAKYYLELGDEMEATLKFNNDAKVYVDGTEITTGFDVEMDGNNKFAVKFDNAKTISAIKAGSVLTVEYTAELLDTANIGELGNMNKAMAKFSNNPYSKDNYKTETGETPWDAVIVFTYKYTVNKVDSNRNPLAGAEFTLYKKNTDGTYTAIETIGTDGTVTTFEFKGLDDGTYKLSETKTPAGYNTIADIEFKVTAKHTDVVAMDSIAADDATRKNVLTEINGEKVSGSIDTFAFEKTTGGASANVVNYSGAELPSTGGIGTTLFYLFGSIMAAGSALILVVRRRAEAEEE